MVYETLVRQAETISSTSMADTPPIEGWKRSQPQLRQDWLDMLGLWPLPQRTEMHVTVTGTVEKDDFAVDKLHFQPVPGCRIAANLYRPRRTDRPLPAILYVCGHAARGKFNYQEHPRWFARHGYVAMIVDAIQIGENGGFHHGTYSKGWWHWYSQGYSPVAVEVWAAMRAADYLQSRDDVDGERLGITGNSGGGTVSWFTGAADPRFAAVAPSCQTGTVFQHIRDRTIDGHCDCTFWVNHLGWDLPDVAALIAPRPLLIAAATEDGLFRPYAFREVYQRTRRLYAAYGQEEDVSLVEALTPHGYSPKTRKEIFAFFDKHLKGKSPKTIDDVDSENLPDGELAVYPDQHPPADDRLNLIDRVFVPPAQPSLPEPDTWEASRARRMEKLRAYTFLQIPRLPLAPPPFECRLQGASGAWRFLTFEFEPESGIRIRLNVALPSQATEPVPVLLAPMQTNARTPYACQGGRNAGIPPRIGGYACVEVRATGTTAIGPGLEWTCRRAYPILGQTLYERQTLDFMTAAEVLRQSDAVSDVVAFGSGGPATVALYAALLDPRIPEVVLESPVESHWNAGPEFLNVLKTGDLPHNAALLCPRTLTFLGELPPAYRWTAEAYRRCEAQDALRTIRTLADWTPAPARTALAE